MIARLAVLSLLCLPLLAVWLGTRKSTVPTHRQHHRVLPPDALLEPAPQQSAELAFDPSAEHVSFPCRGCGGESSLLEFRQTALVQTPTGYALTAVCRTTREHSDGRVAPCGRALIGAVVDASVAAVFVDKGARAQYNRLVVFRAELGNADLVDKIVRP